MAATLPRKVVRSSKPPSRARRSASDRSGPSPMRSRRAGILRRIASKIASTSAMRLTGRKFETWTIRASPSRASARANAEAPSGRYWSVSTKLGTTSIGRPHAELADRHVAQVAGDRRHRVALLDAPAGDRQIRAVLADDRDVGAVQRRDDLQRHAVAVAHLARQDRRDRVRQRVVDVQQVEARARRDLRHLRGQRERVRRRDEERVGRRDDLVEVDALAAAGRAARAARRR